MRVIIYMGDDTSVWVGLSERKQITDGGINFGAFGSVFIRLGLQIEIGLGVLASGIYRLGKRKNKLDHSTK